MISISSSRYRGESGYPLRDTLIGIINEITTVVTDKISSYGIGCVHRAAAHQ